MDLTLPPEPSLAGELFGALALIEVALFLLALPVAFWVAWRPPGTVPPSLVRFCEFCACSAALFFVGGLVTAWFKAPLGDPNARLGLALCSGIIAVPSVICWLVIRSRALAKARPQETLFAPETPDGETAERET